MKIVNVVAAVIYKDNKILSMQRGYGEFKGQWEFPGGKIEIGEGPEMALKREIKEELNVEIAIENDLGVIEYDYPTFHLKMRCYICKLLSEQISLLEHKAMRWLTIENIDTVDWLPADISLLDKIIAYINSQH